MNQEIIKAPRPREEDFLNFECNIPQLVTNRVVQANGYFSEKNSVSIKETKGFEDIIITSVLNSKDKYKDILNKYNIALESIDGNGLFIYIPDNKQVDIPLQMLDIIRADFPVSIETNNIIILGRDSKLKLIHCDDSVNDNKSISDIRSKFYLDKRASLEYYKMENINNDSIISIDSEFNLEQEAELITFWLSINGGDIKNKLEVNLNGEYSKADLNGLYLTDKEQIVDNKIKVNHHKPNCFSNQLYKGILDDSARGEFNGHVYVEKGATKTIAYQNNKNILLTDKAVVNTQPFLEIYNDDVKCSHGATIGQLDDNAMFYLRSRGISQRSARMLLMYAFCNDILLKASIEELKERLGDIIKRRLHGELSTCENCVLHCSTPDLAFDIDLSKI